MNWYFVVIGVGAILVVFLLPSPEPEEGIRVAFFPNTGHIIPIVGIEKGIFPDSHTRIFDSGPQVVESLFAKSIDIAYVGPGPAVNGFLKSGKIVILAGAASGGSSFIVHPNSNITSHDDLGGKKIAAPQIANTQDVSLRSYLSEHKFHTAEYGGSVFVLNVANPEIYTLFSKGDIDAAWVPEPWASILVDELDGVRLFREESLWPNNEFASVLLIARTDYIKENPTIIQRWLVSHNNTISWINSNQEESAEIFNKFIQKEFGVPFPDHIVHEALSNTHITSDPIKSSIEKFAERANSLGYLGRNGYNLDGLFFTPVV